MKQRLSHEMKRSINKNIENVHDSTMSQLYVGILQNFGKKINNEEIIQYCQNYWNTKYHNHTAKAYLSKIKNDLENLKLIECIKDGRLIYIEVFEKFRDEIEQILIENNLCKPKVIPPTIEELSKIDREINGEPQKNNRPRSIILVGGFPNIQRKFVKVASELNIRLIILGEKIQNLPNADLIIYCSKIMSHSNQELVNKLNKNNIPSMYINSFNVNQFRQILENFIKYGITHQQMFEDTIMENTVPEDVAPEDIIIENTVTKNIVPEDVASKDTIIENIVPEDIALEDTIIENAVSENIVPEDNICLCHLIISECEDKIKAAILAAEDNLKNIDLFSGKIKIKLNYSDNEYKKLNININF